jgi:SAM-dependent methyltransferase
MPYSNLEQIPTIISEIKHQRPRSIIDVGCGIGVYGFMIRIYLEMYDDDKNFLKKLLSSLWDIRIDAIEGFRPYVDFIPRWAYDRIMVGDVFEILPKLPSKSYDLALAVAILEHLERKDGDVFLEELKRIAKKVIVSVPKIWGPQQVLENPLENHRSHWIWEDFQERGFSRIIPHDRSLIVVWEEQ